MIGGIEVRIMEYERLADFDTTFPERCDDFRPKPREDIGITDEKSRNSAELFVEEITGVMPHTGTQTKRPRVPRITQGDLQQFGIRHGLAFCS